MAIASSILCNDQLVIIDTAYVRHSETLDIFIQTC